MALIRRIRDDVKRTTSALRRWGGPRLRRADIDAALQRLSPEAPPLVIVHSSLSACGHVEGGAATVIDALSAWCGAGTLAMPAHSYCYPDAGGSTPLFDVSRTPSLVGAITDAFWRRPGVRRSVHPTHSLAASGPGAIEVTHGHESCATPCGSGTPYEQLVRRDAAVLMFGVSLHTYTLFHTAEDAAQVPYLYEPSPVALRYLGADGSEHVMQMQRQDVSVARSFRDKDSWLEGQGLLRRSPLGVAELLWIPHAAAVHEATVRALRQQPGFLTVA